MQRICLMQTKGPDMLELQLIETFQFGRRFWRHERS